MSSTVVPTSPAPPAPRRVFGARPFHLDGDLLALAFGPDGALASVEEPGVLRRWDAAGRRQLDWRTLDEPANLWSFSPDGRLLVAASDELTLWEAATGEAVGAWAVEEWTTALAFGPGKLLATGHDDGSVRLWDWDEQRLHATIAAHRRPISALAFDRDGKRLATAGEDRVIRFWDAATGKQVGQLVGHTDRIPAMAWHPDGTRFYSAGWDTTARVWDVASGEPIILLNSHAGQVFALALSPDGGLLACADSAGAVHLWDTASNRTMRVLPAQRGEVRCLAFSQDGQTLAMGGTERLLHFYDRRSGAWSADTVNPLLSRTGVAVSPDGNRLFSLGAGTSLRVWDVATGQPGPSPEGAGVLRAFAASGDGTRLAGSRAAQVGGRSVVDVWDAGSGRRVAELLDGPRSPVTVLAFSPDARTLATGGYQASDVWLWDVAAAQPSLLIPDAAAGAAVEALAYHPQGRYLAVGGVDHLATGGNDGRTVLWDVAERRAEGQFPGGALAVAFDPSGAALATAGPAHVVRLWNVADRRLVRELRGHVEAVTCLAYSPDGGRLASGGDDRTVRVWSAEGRLLAVIEVDTQVKALAFTPDGQRLFTGNGNTSCYLLDLPA